MALRNAKAIDSMVTAVSTRRYCVTATAYAAEFRGNITDMFRLLHNSSWSPASATSLDSIFVPRHALCRPMVYQEIL